MPFVLVVYDIGDNDARRKYSDYLKTKGLVRLQRSMFMGRVSTQTLKDIIRVSRKYIDEDRDIIHIIPITLYAYNHITALGKPFTDIRRERLAIVQA